MAKITISTITASFGSVALLNSAFDDIETELNDKVLYRDNPTGEDNSMLNDLDMNSNDILNAGDVATTTITLGGQSFDISSVSGVLPSQTGNADKFLQTNGTASSWEVPTASEITNVPAGNIVAVELQAAIDELDTNDDLKAPLASPALTGTPTSTTAAVGVTTTQIATAAFCDNGFVDQDSETGSASLPSGTTAQRTTVANGLVRANTTLNQIEAGIASNYQELTNDRTGVATGTVDIITATFDRPLLALTDKDSVRLRAAGANTVSATFAPDGLTAKSIVKEGNNATVAGDIAGSGHELVLVYNSSNDNWELLNPANLASTAVFTESFTSTDQTLTVSGLLVLAHSLSASPELVQIRLKNTTSEFNYAVGDEHIINVGLNDDGSSGRGAFITVDSSDVRIRFSNTTGIVGTNKTTGARVILTYANWDLIVRAWV